jgi:hypothetical protein
MILYYMGPTSSSHIKLKSICCIQSGAHFLVNTKNPKSIVFLHKISSSHTCARTTPPQTIAAGDHMPSPPSVHLRRFRHLSGGPRVVLSGHMNDGADFIAILGPATQWSGHLRYPEPSIGKGLSFLSSNRRFLKHQLLRICFNHWFRWSSGLDPLLSCYFRFLVE